MGSLKIIVDELCREQDTLVSERATSANILYCGDSFEACVCDVLSSLFALRASYHIWTNRGSFGQACWISVAVLSIE